MDISRSFWREFLGSLSLRRDNGPIDSVAGLNHFVATRSAFIAQKTLYGYLKTRMGTRYPLMFDDDVFVHSINIAKMHVFAACLSDLTVFAIAQALRDVRVHDDSRRVAALRCYDAGIAANTGEAPNEFSPESAIEAFSSRLDETDWHNGALHWENFTRSPDALVKWAPIAPELKQYDVEIVQNSIRYAWRDIREQLRKRPAVPVRPPGARIAATRPVPGA